MTIRIIIDQLPFPGDANRRIALLVAEELKRQGHRVDLLSLAVEDVLCEEELSCPVHYIQNLFCKKMDAVYRALDKREVSIWQVVLQHPLVALASLFRRLFGLDYKVYAYRKAMETLSEQMPAMQHISFTAPYYTARALAVADIPGLKTIYMLDPYSTHPVQVNHKVTAEEKKVFQQVDRVCMPPYIIEEYANITAFQPFSKKMISVEFPLTPDYTYSQETTAASSLLAAEKTWLLFTGRLYPGLREAGFLLTLLQSLPSMYALCIAGPNEEYFKEEPMRKLVQMAGDHLCLLPTQSPSQVHAYQQQAAILLNIDNNGTRMVPSKLFELFASGKPVLNISKSEQSPSVAYVAKYPLGLTILEDQQPPQQAAAILNRFLKETISKNILYSDTLSVFSRHTIHSVTASLLIT